MRAAWAVWCKTATRVCPKKPHLEMVYGKIRYFVNFKQFLGHQRFAGHALAAKKDYHYLYFHSNTHRDVFGVIMNY